MAARVLMRAVSGQTRDLQQRDAVFCIPNIEVSSEGRF